MESNISRDHIALEAMKVLLESNLEVEQTLGNKIKVLFGGQAKINYKLLNCKLAAKYAYEYADAMIAEREKEKSVEE